MNRIAFLIFLFSFPHFSLPVVVSFPLTFFVPFGAHVITIPRRLQWKTGKRYELGTNGESLPSERLASAPDGAKHDALRKMLGIQVFKHGTGDVRPLRNRVHFQPRERLDPERAEAPV